MVPDIPACCRVLPVPFGRNGSSRLLSRRLCLHPYSTVHREHKWREVAPPLKASLDIFSLFVPLVLRQDVVWVSPIIGCCIFVNNMNVEETHLTRAREAKHSSIPMEVSANLTFLCIWIPPCDHYPATPYYSGRCLPCCNDPMYFGFVGYCNWGVCRPAHIRPHLVQEIMTDTYNPPPSCNSTHDPQ